MSDKFLGRLILSLKFFQVWLAAFLEYTINDNGYASIFGFFHHAG